MKKRWKKTHMMKQIIIALILISIVPLSFAMGIIYMDSVNTLTEQYILSNRMLVQQGTENLNTFLSYKDESLLSLYLDSEFWINPKNETKDISSLLYNEDLFRRMLFQSGDVSNITYYVKDTNCFWYYTRLFSSSCYLDVEEEDWYQKTMEAKHNIYVQPLNHHSELINDKVKNISTTGITLHRQVKNIFNGEVYGIVSMNIEIDAIKRVFDGMASEDTIVVLCNTAGEVIYQDKLIDEQLLEIPEELIEVRNSEGVIEYAGEQYQIFCADAEYDLILMKLIPLQQITEMKYHSQYNVVILFLLLLIIICLTAAWTSRKITRPVTVMVDEMNEKIDQLVYSELQSQIATKNAQIRALQSQIEPHYIYNALQSIGALALRHDAEDVYEMLLALANMMRYASSFGDETVSLMKEIQNINNYYLIQKIRFKDRLVLEIDLEEQGILDCHVPPFLLQPLVENSIKYGYGDKRQAICIKIHVTQKEDCLHILVQDTGVGISEQMLHTIQKTINHTFFDEEENEHYGIRNIWKRIYYIYGDMASMNVNSSTGGTQIKIVLPVHYETK